MTPSSQSSYGRARRVLRWLAFVFMFLGIAVLMGVWGQAVLGLHWLFVTGVFFLVTSLVLWYSYRRDRMYREFAEARHGGRGEVTPSSQHRISLRPANACPVCGSTTWSDPVDQEIHMLTHNRPVLDSNGSYLEADYDD